MDLMFRGGREEERKEEEKEGKTPERTKYTQRSQVQYEMRSKVGLGDWREISLVVQWLRHLAPNAWEPGSIPSQRTRSHRPQLSI